MNRFARALAFAASLWVLAPAHAEADLTIGISEGTSGGIDHARAVAKYSGFADLLGRALKRRVLVVFAREFSSVEEGMSSGRFDLLFARPSDYPARAVRDHGYQFVASAKPDGQCLIITKKDSPIHSLADAKGKRWVLPEQVSYMSKFCAAELRDQGVVIAKEKVQYVREQGTVTQYLDTGFADVGAIASYSGPAKTLEKTGHVLLHKSRSQPYFPLVAGKRITAEQRRALQTELSAMTQNEAGRAVLKTLGIESFDTSSGERLQALPAWLGG